MTCHPSTHPSINAHLAQQRRHQVPNRGCYLLPQRARRGVAARGEEEAPARRGGRGTSARGHCLLLSLRAPALLRLRRRRSQSASSPSWAARRFCCACFLSVCVCGQSVGARCVAGVVVFGTGGQARDRLRSRRYPTESSYIAIVECDAAWMGNCELDFRSQMPTRDSADLASIDGPTHTTKRQGAPHNKGGGGRFGGSLFLCSCRLNTQCFAQHPNNTHHASSPPHRRRRGQEVSSLVKL